MQLRLLHLDDAFDGQHRFLDRCKEFGARRIDLRGVATEVRLWGRKQALKNLQEKIADELAKCPSGPASVTWLGSGDFHHVTALLLSLTVAAIGSPVTVVHFDNHPDWVRCANDIHCGSWVSHVLQTGLVERVVSLGLSSADLAWPEFKRADLSLVAGGQLVLFPLNRPSSMVWGSYGNGAAHLTAGHRVLWKQFSDLPEAGTVQAVLDSIETEAVYITIDKDALEPSYARTNWDQGLLTIDGLIAWLRIMIGERTIVGVDVSGDYSHPVYGGSAIDVWRKKGEAFVDQPRTRLPRKDDAQVNETSNLQLLSTLAPLLC
jgi:hypothetical protein